MSRVKTYSVGEMVQGATYSDVDIPEEYCSIKVYRMVRQTLQCKFLVDLNNIESPWNDCLETYNDVAYMRFTLRHYEPQEGYTCFYPCFDSLSGYRSMEWTNSKCHQLIKSNIDLFPTAALARQGSIDRGWIPQTEKEWCHE